MLDWAIPQYVYVYAHNDKLEEDEKFTTLSLEITGEDGFYNNTDTTPIDIYDVTVTVQDNDQIEVEDFGSSLYTSCRQTKLFQYTDSDKNFDYTQSEWLNDYNCEASDDRGGLPGYAL